MMETPMASWQTHVGPLCLQTTANPISLLVLPDDLLKEAIPGNIRKAEHFVAFLKRFVEYLRFFSFSYLRCCHLKLLMIHQTRMRVLHVVAETPLSFLQHLKDITYIERRPLRSARHSAVPVS